MVLDTIIIIILFLIGMAIAYFIGNKAGHKNRERYWLEQIPIHRKEAIAKSRAVIGGQFSENLAPFLPNFKYLPTECRFVVKPIDFLVFKGLDDKHIEEVIFVEVKSGKSKLSQHEKRLKEVIDAKKVKWVEYRIPEEITKNKDINSEEK